MAMRTKTEFDREFILTQLPEKFEYVLNTWDVMWNRRFFFEGRVVGDFDTDKVKKWLDIGTELPCREALYTLVGIQNLGPKYSCAKTH